MSVEETVVSPVRTGWRVRLRQSDVGQVFSLPPQGLWRRTARGAAWAFGLRTLDKVLVVIRMLVLARLLTPRDFGLFAIVLIAVSALDVLNINSLRSALIQKQEETRRDLDTVWSVLFIQNCLNAAVLLLIAGPVAAFFREPGAAVMIRAFSIALLLEALVNVGTIHFEKRLMFHKQFAFILTGAAVDFVVAVSIATVYQSVWALVAGALAGKAARLLASYMLLDFRPSLRFDARSFRQLFRFGGWIWASTALWFALLQGDHVVAGRALGTVALGIYALAYVLVSITRTDIGIALQRIVFPSFAAVVDSPEELRRGYLKLLRGIALCTAPIFVGFAALAPEIAGVLLGPDWAAATPLIRILALLAALHVFLGNAGSLLRTMDDLRQAGISELVGLGVSAILIFPLAAKLQLAGVAWAMAIGALAAWAWAERAMVHKLQIPLRELVRAFELSFAAALVMLATIYLVRGLFLEISWLSFVVQFVAGGLMYAVTIALAALSSKRMPKTDAAAY